jgi:Caspase domain
MLLLRNHRLFRPQVAAALALAIAFLLAPAAWAGDLYMVSVGVTNAIGHPKLTATAKDAKDMAAWGASQKGKMFQNVHITTLTDNNATVKNVVAALNSMKNKARAGDYMIFYDSSHGGNDGNGKYIMCVYDGNLQWSQVLDAFRDSSATKIVILDTCESGLAVSSAQGMPVVFASSSSTQSSFDGTNNSLYTQYLLDGLKGKADTDKNGFVSLVEATSYAGQMLQKADKGKKASDQQNSTWSRPKNIEANLPIAKLTNGLISNSTVTTKGGDPVYSGKEDLKGFGSLSFTLHSDGKVVMHDAKSTVNGTYTRSGNQVTLSFPRVGATYQGTMNGFQISGHANDTRGQEWTFSVNRKS